MSMFYSPSCYSYDNQIVTNEGKCHKMFFSGLCQLCHQPIVHPLRCLTGPRSAAVTIVEDLLTIKWSPIGQVRTKSKSWQRRFNYENDVLFGPQISKKTESLIVENPNETLVAQVASEPCLKQKSHQTLEHEEVTNSQKQSSFDDLKQIVHSVPTLVNTSFPLLNPWRSQAIYQNLKEAELLEKRKLVLNEHNVVLSRLPSVTKILSETMSQSSLAALEKWKLKMVEKLGMEDFRDYQRKLFERGRLFHQNIAHQLKGEPSPEIQKEIAQLWKSLGSVFQNIDQVSVIEKPVHHPFLCYKGIVDCVAVYKRHLVVIDWKTASRFKPSITDLYDEPLQAVAYAGALNYDGSYSVQVENVALVIAYENGSPATIHRLSSAACRHYWTEWLNRLHNYYKKLDEINKINNLT